MKFRARKGRAERARAERDARREGGRHKAAENEIESSPPMRARGCRKVGAPAEKC